MPKFVKQTADIVEYPNTPKGIIQKIEMAARTCYQSADKITDDSASALIVSVLSKKHYSVFGHHYVTMVVHDKSILNDLQEIAWGTPNREGKFSYREKTLSFFDITVEKESVVLSANLRTFYELNNDIRELRERNANVDTISRLTALIAKVDFILPSFCLLSRVGWSDQFTLLVAEFEKKIDFLDEKELWNHFDYLKLEARIGEFVKHTAMTVKIVTDRRIETEIVRHNATYSISSTRFCNFAKEKFGSEISMIDFKAFKYDKTFEALSEKDKGFVERELKKAAKKSEKFYMSIMKVLNSPQIARYVLMSGNKADVVATMKLKRWLHFFDLRLFGDTGIPHPQIKDIARKLFKKFQRRYRTASATYLKSRGFTGEV